ncbi:hypothetical protein GCM10009104_02820 [Marinobacterium maritimum]|uniref:Uncharacterized protein n=1 Tax=Marinobacterium maritimum TaxID=500162 RepID=A0ABP3TC67_9GAMM
MIPIKIETPAISQTNILGSNIISTPTKTRRKPGSINRYTEPGFCAIPLQVDAIGHILTLFID